MKEGDKVTYLEGNEKGIIKEVRGEFAWVVYKCDNNWDRYFDYTGARCKLTELAMGWPEDEMKVHGMSLKDNQEAFNEKEPEYVCTINEMREDMKIFTQRMNDLGKPITANKFSTIESLLKCAAEKMTALATRKKWDFDN